LGLTSCSNVFVSLESKCEEDGGYWVVDLETGEGNCKRDYYEDPLSPEGESSETDAESEPAEEPEDELSSEVDTSVPDGIYVGTTTLPEYWENITDGWYPGVVTENEITIIVAADGTVSGAMIAIRKGDKSTPIKGCVSRITLSTEGTLSGQLTEIGGIIEFQLIDTKEIWRSGCPSGTDVQTESGKMQAQVSIINNRIIKGAIPNHFSFETTKR